MSTTTPTGPAPLDALAVLARHQGGVFTRDQARVAGFSRDAIAHRVRTGRWLRRHGPVLVAATSDVGARGLRWSALLHAGPAAVLSHRTAAELWGMGVAGRGPVQLTTTAGRTPDVPGAAVTRTTLEPTDVDVLDGLPVTSRTRTLLDCLATVTPSQAQDLLEWCDRSRLLTPHQLDLLVAQRQRFPGVAQLRTLQTWHHLRSGWHGGQWLARRLRDSDVAGWVAEHPVPTPTGVQLVPVAFPELRLALVVDDRVLGPSSRPLTADRELVLAGWVVLHLGWDEVHGPPRALRALLVRALSATAGSASRFCGAGSVTRNPVTGAP